LLARFCQANLMYVYNDNVVSLKILMNKDEPFYSSLTIGQNKLECFSLSRGKLTIPEGTVQLTSFIKAQVNELLTWTFKKEVNCTVPSPFVGFPCLKEKYSSQTGSSYQEVRGT
jgi:hypothetical protein